VLVLVHVVVGAPSEADDIPTWGSAPYKVQHVGNGVPGVRVDVGAIGVEAEVAHLGAEPAQNKKVKREVKREVKGRLRPMKGRDGPAKSPALVVGRELGGPGEGTVLLSAVERGPARAALVPCDHGRGGRVAG